MMRAMGLGLAAVALGAAAPPAVPAGFDEIAARSERIDMLGVPMWMSGRFRLGDDATRGRVSRKALGKTQSAGFAESERQAVARYGSLSFDIAGPAVRGALAGDCRYERGEDRLVEGALTTSAPSLALQLRCSFVRDGAAVGEMVLDALPMGGGIAPSSGRAGEVRLGDTVLGIASLHGFAGSKARSDLPLGYRFDADGQAVGAIDTNGFTRRRLALPHDPAQREAALAAGLVLGLFWDPGDTDD